MHNIVKITDSNIIYYPRGDEDSKLQFDTILPFLTEPVQLENVTAKRLYNVIYRDDQVLDLILSSILLQNHIGDLESQFNEIAQPAKFDRIKVRRSLSKFGMHLHMVGETDAAWWALHYDLVPTFKNVEIIIDHALRDKDGVVVPFAPITLIELIRLFIGELFYATRAEKEDIRDKILQEPDMGSVDIKGAVRINDGPHNDSEPNQSG